MTLTCDEGYLCAFPLPQQEAKHRKDANYEGSEDVRRCPRVFTASPGQSELHRSAEPQGKDRDRTTINVDPVKAKKTPKKSIAAILLQILVTCLTPEARLTVSNYHTPS